jgi:Type II secretion system (T2SS), protein F
MTAPPVIAVAALLAMLTVAVAFRALGPFGRRGRGLDGGSFRLGERRMGRSSFQERRSLCEWPWILGRSRTWGSWSRTRRRRSASLDRPVSPENQPIAERLGGPSGPTKSPGPTAAIDSNRASNAGAGRSSVPVPGRASPFDVGSDLGSGSGPGSSYDPGSGSGAGPAGRPRPPDAPGREGRAERRPVNPFDRAHTRIPMPGRAAARRREMEEAVPEVVDVLRATVAAGINPRRALQAAAEGTPSVLSDVLGQAIRAAELGSGAGQALAAAAKAERLSELELAGEALDLAETTGAPPGPVLAGVAIAATDRVRSRQAVLAATAQARLSARVVAAMAPAFLGMLALTSPSDAAFLIREPAGWATLTAATVLELLGICWATSIVRGPAP